MLFRGKQPEATVWRRFRSGIDAFSFAREDGYYAAHVVANAERVVDLLHALAEQLPPAVDVALEDARAGRAWAGEGIALPDLRDAVARLRVPLATYGGVEVAVYSADDQLTLTPHLELFVYGRTDQWLYILQGKGLEEAASLRPRRHRRGRADFPPAPAMSDAIAAAAERLGLRSTRGADERLAAGVRRAGGARQRARGGGGGLARAVERAGAGGDDGARGRLHGRRGARRPPPRGDRAAGAEPSLS